MAAAESNSSVIGCVPPSRRCWATVSFVAAGIRLLQIRKAALDLRFKAVKHIRKHRKEYEAAWVQDDIEQQYPLTSWSFVRSSVRSSVRPSVHSFFLSFFHVLSFCLHVFIA